MNETVIIIDAYLNNQYKIDFFSKTFESIKKLNLPIMLISNIRPPDKFIDSVDHFIFVNRNLLFTDSYDKYSEVCFFMESDILRYENNTKCYQKHGLSVISNLKIASEHAKHLGYKKFIRIEWDFQINENDIGSIKNLINNFSTEDKRAYFIYNPSNCSHLPDYCYHFWMVDLKFWNENFPTINNENDYKFFLKKKTGDDKSFQTAERILYLIFHDIITEEERILESDFREIYKKSVINFFINDINFDLPSDNGVCCGLCLMRYDGQIRNELGLFTWNRNNPDTINRTYKIHFQDCYLEYMHELAFDRWQLTYIPEFTDDKFPIKLEVSNNSNITYNSWDEIARSIVIFKNR